MRRMDAEGRDSFLESERREVNEVLAYGAPRESDRRPKRHDDYGPPWGFAGVGDRYGQNRPGFFGR